MGTHIRKRTIQIMKIISALAPFALAAPPMGGVGVCFVGSIYQCVPVMESPICTEGDPAFNPLVCAVKANRCFLESMSGIPDCLEQINETSVMELGDHVTDLKCFYNWVSSCGDASQNGVCDENNANYNPIVCAMKLNRCLTNGFDPLFDCMNGEPAKMEEKDIDAIGITECFVNWVTACEEKTHSRLCDESSPDYNAVACAIQLNRCLIGGTEELNECMAST